MANLSKSKKKRLQRNNRQQKLRSIKQQQEVQAEVARIEHAYTERPIAAYVRLICNEHPEMMLGWSYPKEPRAGFNYIVLKNHTGDNMYVYGAPYRQKPDDIAGLKMAEEIDLPCDIDIPTADFSTPDPDTFAKGITQAMETLLNKGELFIGCMGGIGRTGLAIAGLLKLHDKMFQGGTRKAVAYRDHIRKHVHPHAIETQQQLAYIDDYTPTTI